MERVRRLAALWSWLPAFRVVAECQHLPTASKQLHVSPSALSRTVRLLEEEVGQALFVREGRSLRINDAGERFLASTRDAMRILDEGLAVLDEAQTSGPLHLAIPGDLTRTLAQALSEVTQEHKKLVPNIHQTSQTDIVAALLAGRLDVALTEVGISHDRLQTTHVTTIERRAYAAPHHAARHTTSIEGFAEEGFVAPPVDEAGAPGDGWPGGVPRQVTMVTTNPAFALEIARAGHHMIYLPRMEARKDLAANTLVEVDIEITGPTQIYALTRPTLGPGAKAEMLVENLQRAFERMHASA